MVPRRKHESNVLLRSIDTGENAEIGRSIEGVVHVVVDGDGAVAGIKGSVVNGCIRDAIFIKAIAIDVVYDARNECKLGMSNEPTE